MDRREFLTGAALAALAGVSGEWPALAQATGERNLRALARALDGPVLRPGGAAYARARPAYNLRYATRRPSAIVQPVSAADVRAALRWAARTGERIVARSGGHSYAAYSTPDGATVLDLRRLRRVAVSGRTVTVGAGAQSIDVHAALARRGLTLPTGSCPSVGIAGLTLGGGIGLQGRRLGLTADRLVGATIVTADGVLRRVDARTDEDLFWALRGGGGGNFGVVVDFTFDAASGGRGSWAFARWPARRAADVLAAWERWAPETDPRLTPILTLSGAGATLIGQFAGSEAELRRVLQPLTAIDGGAVRTGTAGALELVRRWAGCLERSVSTCHTSGTRSGGALPRARFAAASGFLDKPLPAAGRADLIRLAGGGALIFDPFGGALNEPATDATAFVHRDQRASVQAYTSFPAGGVGRARRWLADVRAALRRHGSGQAYQNYVDPDLGAGFARAYYGANLERLQAVRERYDPDRLLRFEQAIPA